jgi:hypothetical protein
LHAQCSHCGATSHDWRRWLGVGATFVPAPGDPGRMILTYAGACFVCGGDQIEISARG